MKMAGFPSERFSALVIPAHAVNPGCSLPPISLDTRFREYDGMLRSLSLFRFFIDRASMQPFFKEDTKRLGVFIILNLREKYSSTPIEGK